MFPEMRALRSRNAEDGCVESGKESECIDNF